MSLRDEMPLLTNCFTSEDVYNVFALACSYAADRGRTTVFTPMAQALQVFFSSLPKDHELLRHLTLREDFARQVRDLWHAHLAMQN